MLLHKLNLFASPEDRAVHNLFREAKVIVPSQQGLVSGQQLCSICGDGFRHHMKRGVFKRCLESGGDDMFFHEFKGNGEAMRFALNSPLSAGESKYGDPDVWGRKKIDEIVEVLGWADDLGIDVGQHRVVHHWPCKAAKSRVISFAQSIDLVVKGKYRIKHQIQRLRVGIDFFCDWAPDENSIEQIKKEMYLHLIETDPAFARELDSWHEYVEQVSKLPVLCAAKVAEDASDQQPLQLQA